MATPATVYKPFSARYDGKCKSPSCPRGGKIYKGQLVRWHGPKSSVVWHIDCPAPGETATARDEAATRDEAANDAAFLPAETSDSGADSGGEFVTAPTATAPTAKPAHDGGFLAGLADALAPFLDARLKGLVDEADVLTMIGKALDGAILKTVTSVEVFDHANDTARDMGLQHAQFPLLLKVCASRTMDGHRLNIWLAGPAGSGKTTAARNCADALGLPFWFCGAQDNPYGLLGFIDAQGGYRRPGFREVWEFGGIALVDEIDGWNPAALLPFNAALANGTCAFPDAIVPRHKDCVIIAAANTWGMGANSDYVGRLKLDAATLDRFVTLAWDIDEGLELATAGNQDWTQRVQALRMAAKSKGVKVIISPRASFYGAALLASGLDQTTVETLTVRKSMSADQWQSVVAVVAGGAL